MKERSESEMLRLLDRVDRAEATKADKKAFIKALRETDINPYREFRMRFADYLESLEEWGRQ